MLNGQTISQGGIRGRREATRFGTVLRIAPRRFVCGRHEKIGPETGLEDKTVTVQGLGNVGYHAAKYLHEGGAKIVALQEYNSAIYQRKGLTPTRR